MPYNPDTDPVPFSTDEEARKAAFDYIRRLGKFIGHLIPHKTVPMKNDEGEIIGAIYSGTKGTVKMHRDTKPNADERKRGITIGYDVKPEGLPSRHFVSTQRRRKRGMSNG